jgi:hypothetical protein
MPISSLALGASFSSETVKKALSVGLNHYFKRLHKKGRLQVK